MSGTPETGTLPEAYVFVNGNEIPPTGTMELRYAPTLRMLMEMLGENTCLPLLREEYTPVGGEVTPPLLCLILTEQQYALVYRFSAEIKPEDWH